MGKYHVNGKGEPGLCKAQFSCPFGGIQDHYDSPEVARAAFEVSMTTEDSSQVVEPVKKERAQNWAIVRYSNITDKYYLDHTYAQKRTALKELNLLNQYDHHSASYSIMKTPEAKNLIKENN